MKKVFISGSLGNMGRRYSAILDYLDIYYEGSDINNPLSSQAMYVRDNDFDGVIVATPTHNHTDALNIFSSFCKVPILIEKPVTKHPILDDKPYHPCTVVNQYKYMVDESREGETLYDYFKTGSDGLFWDCYNIIGLAKDKVTLSNKSPIWTCVINGQELSLKDMDKAYVEMIKDWTENPEPNIDYIKATQNKVMEMIKKHEKVD